MGKNKYTITINLKNAVKCGAIATVGYIVGSITEQFVRQSIHGKKKLKTYEDAYGILDAEEEKE